MCSILPCADFVAEVTQQRPTLRPGCELGLAATASLEAMAGVIALTYHRKLQGGDLSLTRHMERLAVAGGRRAWPTCEGSARSLPA
jgi:hypothetical protein